MSLPQITTPRTSWADEAEEEDGPPGLLPSPTALLKSLEDAKVAGTNGKEAVKEEGPAKVEPTAAPKEAAAPAAEAAPAKEDSEAPKENKSEEGSADKVAAGLGGLKVEETDVEGTVDKPDLTVKAPVLQEIPEAHETEIKKASHMAEQGLRHRQGCMCRRTSSLCTRNGSVRRQFHLLRVQSQPGIRLSQWGPIMIWPRLIQPGISWFLTRSEGVGRDEF